MPPALPALLLVTVLGLSGCGGGGDSGDSEAAPSAGPAGGAFSQQVRGNFLDSCIENARNTAGGAASEEQLAQTCECILGKVEQEYSESEFAQFEQRLLSGRASDEESDRLVGWSTDCARDASS